MASVLFLLLNYDIKACCKEQVFPMTLYCKDAYIKFLTEIKQDFYNYFY